MASRGGRAEGTAELEVLLRHRFERPELLLLAMTHRSFVYDTGAASAESERADHAAKAGRDERADCADRADPSQDNEQLEFMGDAALGLLAAETLCRRFPGSREGDLTRMRASVVSRKHLGEVGTRLGLGRWLRLGQTAEKNQGRTNAALFANAVEALIAALYLDGGLEAARRFVEREVLAPALPELERSLAVGDPLNGATGDHKSALQEMLQAQGLGTPQYRLLSETGPDHRRLFRIEARLKGDESAAGSLAQAEGTSKKEAQQEAARLALQILLRRSSAPAGEGSRHG